MIQPESCIAILFVEILIAVLKPLEEYAGNVLTANSVFAMFASRIRSLTIESIINFNASTMPKLLIRKSMFMPCYNFGEY